MYGLGKPLDSLLMKVERAKKHVLDLESERGAFFQTNPYSFSNSTNPVTGDRTYYIKSVEPVLMMISIILGDALNNLRCALDHLVHHLACVGAGTTGPVSTWTIQAIIVAREPSDTACRNLCPQKYVGEEFYSSRDSRISSKPVHARSMAWANSKCKVAVLS